MLLRAMMVARLEMIVARRAINASRRATFYNYHPFVRLFVSAKIVKIERKNK